MDADPLIFVLPYQTNYSTHQFFQESKRKYKRDVGVSRTHDLFPYWLDNVLLSLMLDTSNLKAMICVGCKPHVRSSTVPVWQAQYEWSLSDQR